MSGRLGGDGPGFEEKIKKKNKSAVAHNKVKRVDVTAGEKLQNSLLRVCVSARGGDEDKRE